MYNLNKLFVFEGKISYRRNDIFFFLFFFFFRENRKINCYNGTIERGIFIYISPVNTRYNNSNNNNILRKFENDLNSSRIS